MNANGLFSIVVVISFVSILAFHFVLQKVQYYGQIQEMQFTCRKDFDIPRRIHQTWDSYNVPQDFVPKIKSWMDKNPGWEYWFWTPSDVRELLMTSYPGSIPLYDSYNHITYRADVMKYFVLHSFGGFYADLDTECLKPLQNWTNKHQCILNRTPFELDYLFHKRKEPSIATAIMACRLGHPLFEQIIKSLPAFRRMKSILKATGPFFMDLMVRRYTRQLPKSPPQDIPCNLRLEVLNSSYFIPTSDPGQMEHFRNKCSHVSKNGSDTLMRRACQSLSENSANTPSPTAYANHIWIHMFAKEGAWRTKPSTSIYDIVPNVITFRKLSGRSPAP